MYKFKGEKQISFTDFNQPLGMQMNPDNRWVKKAAMLLRFLRFVLNFCLPYLQKE